MVRRRKKAASSSQALEEDKAAETALAETKTSDSVTVDVEEPKVDAQVKDKEELTVDEERHENPEEVNSEEEGNKEQEETNKEGEANEKHEETKEGHQKHEETNSEEVGEKVMKVGNDENAIMIGINGDNMAADENTSEDDEIDDQEDVLWEDDEEDDEEIVAEEDGFSDEDDDGDEVSEGEASEEEEVDEEEENIEGEKEIATGNEGEAEKQNTEKVEVSLRNMEKSTERGRKRKMRADKPKVDPGDKPESSGKKKTKKRVESMGMIFICSSKTKKDCYQYRVLGLPEGKKDTVEKIYTGMRLFLYDVDLKLMYGIYKAAGPGGYNIEPKAFKSQFPSQVRFKVLDDCLPLPEEKFKKVIKENYYTNNKFDCILNSEQVKKLCKLFISSSKGQQQQQAKRLGGAGRSRKSEKPLPVRRERIRRPRLADERIQRPRLANERIRRPRLADERIRRPRLREERGSRNKRPRKAVSPLRRPLTPPPLRSSDVRSYPYERTLDVNATTYRRDPYLERRASPYRDVRDPYPYTERRDLYRDPYPERRDSYRDGRDPYLERRDPYRDLPRDPYLESRDPYRDGRDPYAERRGIYRDAPLIRSETYGSSSGGYRRGDPLEDRRDVYRREEVLGGRREIQPLSLETRDSYVSYRERPSYADPIYSSAGYPSRAGLTREYHL